MNPEIAAHQHFTEPKLLFHPERLSDCDVHPLRGLLRFGPYSSGLIPDPIRIATIAPAGQSQQLYKFMGALNQKFIPTERRDYLDPWPGFRAVFGLNMIPAGRNCHIELEPELEESFNQSTRPHAKLADALVRAIQGLESVRSNFDVLFIYIPQHWEWLSTNTEDQFDLHDHIKAFSAMRGLPVQLVRENGALSYGDRASVMWRIGIAVYAKAGGVPWKLAESEEGTAYIGISYAVRPSESEQSRFVTCCSQVFDGEGSGLEFVAYDAHEVEVQRDNPFLSRTEMFRVMTRSVDLYRRRHAGRSPKRVMVHKTTEFKSDELDGAMEALHLCEAVDLTQIVKNVGWSGVRIQRPQGRSQKGAPAAYPVERGTLIDISPREALLWTHGDVSGVGKRGSYFQGAKSTPSPIRLVRHSGHGPWDDTAKAILGLTKMNWNNDALYDAVPVTIGFASVLAGVVKRIPKLGTAPYQFRFFM